jgi:hypothetical protein
MPNSTGHTATPSLNVLPATDIDLPVKVVGEAAHKAYSPLQTAICACVVENKADTQNNTITLIKVSVFIMSPLKLRVV